MDSNSRESLLSPSNDKFSSQNLERLNKDAMQLDNDQLASTSLFPFLPSADAVSDDGFRGVIDDLTIKNQRLKRRIKRLQRVNCTTLSEDKLFEVRFHSLPLSKKLELEALLQQFTANINKPATSPNNSSVEPTPSSNPVKASKPEASDSAYATDSRADLPTTANTTTHSASHPSSAHPKKDSPLSIPVSVKFNILSDPTNETLKMKLVVRNLEQLFTGKVGNQGPAIQTKEQQILSEIAAKDDRLSKMGGTEEGSREAPLMTWQEDTDMTSADQDTPDLKEDEEDKSSESSDSLNQRPTRPMDLDPRRAQDPSQNLEYLNHMTHSSNSKSLFTKKYTQNEVSDWVYLNLITNLAQLHTLNVSLPFVKRAIASLSTKLELSADEKKIRWKGGNVGSKLSSDSEPGEDSPSDESSMSDFPQSAVGPKRRSKSAGINNNDSGVSINSLPLAKKKTKSANSARQSGRSLSRHGKDDEQNMPAQRKFHYEPMFVTPQMAKARSVSTSSDFSDTSSEAPSEDSVGLIHSLDLKNGKVVGRERKKLSTDGPISYFDGAPFCSDLSAQIIPHDLLEGVTRFESDTYIRYTEEYTGVDRRAGSPSGGERRPLLVNDLHVAHVALEDIDNDFSESLDVIDSDSILLKSETTMFPLPKPADLPCSGLGGIHPDDNFMINVLAKYKSCKTPNSVKRKLTRHHIPKSSLKVFHDDGTTEMYQAAPQKRKGYEVDIIGINHTRLMPSKLPSPTYYVSLTSDESTNPSLSSRILRDKLTDSDLSYNSPIDLDSDEGEEWNSFDLDKPAVPNSALKMDNSADSVTQPMNAMLLQYNDPQA